jgi:hypothetical protein
VSLDVRTAESARKLRERGPDRGASDGTLHVVDGNDAAVLAMSPKQQLATSTLDVWAGQLAFLVPR